MANSTKASKTHATAADSILQVGMEIIGVGIVAFAAGSNDEMGKIIVWIMLGLWLIWLMNNPGIQGTITKFVGSFSPAPAANAAGQALGNLKFK